MTAPAPRTPSAILPIQPTSAKIVVRFAEAVAGGGARRLFLGQSFSLDGQVALAYLAGRGVRIPLGTSVALTPLRHPVEAALQARSLAAVSGLPYVAGYGVSEPTLVARLRGQPYESPRTAAAHHAGTIRRLLAGEEVELDSPYAPTRLSLPPLEHPPVEVGLGVLRPGMAETAGAVADVAITWLTPLSWLTGTIIPALDAGAERAGRTRPRIVSIVHTAVARTGREPAAMLAGAAGAHLRTKHYTDMLRSAGIDADPRDPRTTARALVDTGLFAAGSPEEVIASLDAYYAAGVDEVVLNVAGVMLAHGFEEALTDLGALLAAAADRA